MDRRPTITPGDLDFTNSPNKIAKTEECLVASGTMRRSTITPRDLKCMLCDATAEPKALPLSLLEEITNGFSDQQKIGSGGFAVVYKGMLENRAVAVKRMSNAFMDEKEFHREVECLMMVKHKNVVRFLGYCADTQGSMERHNGKFVMADVPQRFLCFEYLPKGSLDNYITDTSHGLRWRDRYQIITGICQGLHYLHQKKIVHLDLKPANILLDDSLVAKITDFGTSRCIAEMQSRITSKIAGTIGYLAPESFNTAKVTYQHLYRLDIFSLGIVITEILTGERGYHDVDNAEDAPNELHQDTPNAAGETTSEENATATEAERFPSFSKTRENAIVVTVAGTNPYNIFQKNTANLGTLNETMQSLNPDIRRCFKYCSIFPRGSKLRRNDLARLWIAQGFIKTSCATEEMEDVAEGYFQELVSCSFLQRVTSSGINCFRIHDVLYDILDKVVGNDCFRIENERRQRGEGWEGDVPRYVQHLFIQNYDGELITEKILGLQNLRTLIIDVVGDDTPVEEKVFESIFKELPELRVLAVAFNREHDPINQNKFTVPESICQLKHLRYLAFRTSYSCEVILPSALNIVQHIQLLDFGDGKILEFNCGNLINLRHIFCGLDVKIRNIDMLISLQTIPRIIVSDEQGYEVTQLRGLNKLRGCLDIWGLKNIRSKEEALEANLAAKERITKLMLRWDGDGDWCSPEVEAEVLESLCPPVGLQRLHMFSYRGSRYPDWMMGKKNGGPKDLQELHLWKCSQPGPGPQFVEAFPHLRVLSLWNCSWDALPGNLEHLTSLMYLEIDRCRNIRSLPTLPQSLEVFVLKDCNREFMESCETAGHSNWQKTEHIPKKTIGAGSSIRVLRVVPAL